MSNILGKEGTICVKVWKTKCFLKEQQVQYPGSRNDHSVFQEEKEGSCGCREPCSREREWKDMKLEK